ncbi:MAG: nicotinate (nicotinamide) nucleotide adenylyltransferase [Alphaproteobacteria bacterium]|jgi:nicotinate-nucleotide adenylyltransferase|nr:nicotinate (nicotinamide) nucleotide adenylyltransferase [Alphaproteobacteria bacterium]
MNYLILNNNYFKESTYFRTPQPLRIGLFGGSFNPPHLGHIYLSLTARAILNLDMVIWMITPMNPLKAQQNSHTDLKSRLKLCQEICKNYSFIKIISIEDSFNFHYSYLILRKISTLSALGNKLFWLMGEDNLANIHKFKNWQEIITTYDCHVFARNPKTYETFFKKYAILQKNKKITVHLIPKNPLSSTKIREGN